MKIVDLHRNLPVLYTSYIEEDKHVQYTYVRKLNIFYITSE